MMTQAMNQEKTMNVADRLLLALKSVDTGVDAPGICVQVDRMTGLSFKDVDSVLVPLLESWPGSSGSSAYPVEGNDEDFSAAGKWDKRTVRGRRRHRLLAYLIEALESSDV